MTEKAQDANVSATITISLPEVSVGDVTRLYQYIKNLDTVQNGGRVSLRVDEPNQRRLRPLTRVP